MSTREQVGTVVHRDQMRGFRRQARKLLAGPVANVHEELRIFHAERLAKDYQRELRTMLKYLGLR